MGPTSRSPFAAWRGHVRQRLGVWGVDLHLMSATSVVHNRPEVRASGFGPNKGAPNSVYDIQFTQPMTGVAHNRPKVRSTGIRTGIRCSKLGFVIVPSPANCWVFHTRREVRSTGIRPDKWRSKLDVVRCCGIPVITGSSTTGPKLVEPDFAPRKRAPSSTLCDIVYVLAVDCGSSTTGPKFAQPEFGPLPPTQTKNNNNQEHERSKV